MEGTAVVLAQGMLDHNHAKTAHGLIRGSERYQVTAVIDHKQVGQDAGTVVDGVDRGIPIYASIEDYCQQVSEKAQYMVIGVATKGGYIPEDMRQDITTAVHHGLHIVNGLHEFLADDPKLSQLAQQHQVQLIDIRKPRSKEELQFWTGAIAEVSCPIISVLGTDCALGKRTTARMMMEAAQVQDITAEMIFTGQTGWLQGGKYGFIFDSTYNDFVSGELEHAIVNCYKDLNPDMIFLEGQAALQNPTGPCGAEFLVSARSTGVILQHAPGRKYFGNEPSLGEIPHISREIELIKLYGVPTLAVTLNNEGLDQPQMDRYQQQYEDELGIPVVQPLKEGVSQLISVIQQAHA